MTTFLHPDEETNVDFAESRTKRGRDRVACFLHLRDLVYLHPKAASADAIAFVQSLEAAVIAEKATREKQLAEARERTGTSRGTAGGGSSESGGRRKRRPRSPSRLSTRALGPHKATSRATLGTTGGDGGRLSGPLQHALTLDDQIEPTH
jgi:hypothetical protein